MQGTGGIWSENGETGCDSYGAPRLPAARSARHLVEMAGNKEEVDAAKAKLRHEQRKVDEVRPRLSHALVRLEQKEGEALRRARA